jgi:hypothetical protein
MIFLAKADREHSRRQKKPAEKRANTRFALFGVYPLWYSLFLAYAAEAA